MRDYGLSAVIPFFIMKVKEKVKNEYLLKSLLDDKSLQIINNIFNTNYKRRYIKPKKNRVNEKKTPPGVGFEKKV